MKKVFAAILAAALITASFSACGGTGSASSAASSAAAPASSDNTSAPASSAAGLSGSINISGSSALQPLVQAAADEFKKTNPNVSITVNAGGSGTGLQNVSDKTVDIGDSDIFATEKLSKDKVCRSGRPHCLRCRRRSCCQPAGHRHQCDKAAARRYLYRQNHKLERRRRQRPENRHHQPPEVLRNPHALQASMHLTERGSNGPRADGRQLRPAEAER